MTTRWQAESVPLQQRLAWVGIVLILAAGGAVIVRNVTDTLQTIARCGPSAVIALDQPNR
jgi:hypothetical protein